MATVGEAVVDNQRHDHRTGAVNAVGNILADGAVPTAIAVDIVPRPTAITPLVTDDAGALLLLDMILAAQRHASRHRERWERRGRAQKSNRLVQRLRAFGRHQGGFVPLADRRPCPRTL